MQLLFAQCISPSLMVFPSPHTDETESFQEKLIAREAEMPTFRNQMRLKCLFSFTVSVIRLEVLRECCSLLPPNDWMLWYLKMPWNGNWDPIVHLIMVVNHLWCIILTDQSNFQEKKCKVWKSLFSLKYYLKVSLKFITWNL